MSITKDDLKPEVLDLAAQLTKGIKVNPDGGITVEKDVFYSALPEGLTEQACKDVQKYTQNFVAAAGLTIGEQAIGVMTKNKELARVEGEVPTVGHDKAKYVFDRHYERTARNPQTGDEMQIVKQGQMGVSYTVQGAKNVGQLSKVREFLNDQAAEKFGKK